MGTLIDMDSHDWNARYAATRSMWSEEPNVFLVAKTERMKPGRALDLGCGEGRNALWLAERGWDVTAVDFSKVAIERGRQRASQRGLTVDFRVHDVVGFQPEPSAYDLVVVFYLQLPHTEVRQALDRSAAAVAPGGSILVVAHDLDNLEHGHGGPPMAEVLYTADLVLESLDGFEVVEAGPVDRIVVTEEGDRTAIDTLVLARKP